MVEPSLVVLAHPLIVRGELPVSAAVLAALAVCALIALSVAAARFVRPSDATADALADDQEAVLGPRQGAAFWTARAVGLGLLVLAVTAGAYGRPDELSNIAPALVVGAGWPLLILGSAAIGRVWWWLNPFDTLARATAGLGAGAGSSDPQAPVWWAVVPAAVWMGYITVWPTALLPRTIATVLFVYTLMTVAACLALGRRTWLQRGEFFTVFFGLIAGIRRRGWRVTLPPGAPAVCGVVAGAALFGLVRDSDYGTALAYGLQASLYSRIGVVAFMVVTAALAGLIARRPGGVGDAASVAMIPVAAALALAMALARYRLTTSVQLLPVLASDPFGAGLDLFGTRSVQLQARPFGIAALIWLQVGIAFLGHGVGVLLARGRAAFAATGRRRVDAVLAATALLCLLLTVAVGAVGAI